MRARKEKPGTRQMAPHWEDFGIVSPNGKGTVFLSCPSQEGQVVFCCARGLIYSNGGEMESRLLPPILLPTWLGVDWDLDTVRMAGPGSEISWGRVEEGNGSPPCAIPLTLFWGVECWPCSAPAIALSLPACHHDWTERRET